MIQLHPDYLMFTLPDGESIPCSAELVTIELIGDTSDVIDPELVRQAAVAAFHYFKVELGRERVSVGEFSQALARILRGFGFNVVIPDTPAVAPRVSESDLRALACESGKGFELVFFSRLRDELRSRLRDAPQVVRFKGLRGCVKQLLGARRWSQRCEVLSDQIVNYLRNCLDVEKTPPSCSLVVV